MEQAGRFGKLDVAGWMLVAAALTLAVLLGAAVPMTLPSLAVQALLGWAGFGILLRRQSPIVFVGGGLLLMIATAGAADGLASQVAPAASEAFTVTLAKRLLLVGLSAWMVASLWRNGLLLALDWFGRLLGNPSPAGGPGALVQPGVLAVVGGLLYFFASPPLAWVMAAFVFLSLVLQVLRSAADIAALQREIAELRRRT